MTSPREFFVYNSDVSADTRRCMFKITSTITAETDKIARAAVESVRGTSIAEEVKPTEKVISSFRCSVCGEHTHSSSGYAPLFCQRCGRLFEKYEEARDD